MRVDLEVRAAHVEYAPEPSAATVDLNEPSSVAYDVDASGNSVGVEVLQIHLPEQIEIARRFAQAHDLAFPRESARTLVTA